MRLRAPEVERRLRKGALRIINATPRLKREYRKHRSPRFWGRLTQESPVPLTLLVHLVFPAMLGIAAGKGAAASETSFGLASVIAGVIAIGVAMNVIGQLRCSHDLAVLSLVPLRDAEIVRHRQRRTLRIGIVVIPLTLIFYGAWALAWELPAGRAAVVLCLAGLQFAVIVGLGFVLAGLLPARIERLGCLGLTAATVVAIVLAAVHFSGLPVAVPWQGVAAAANMLLPTGWIHCILHRGFIEQDRSVWLMLLPIAVLLAAVPASMGSLRTLYRLREIQLAGGGTAAAVFESPADWYGVPTEIDPTELQLVPLIEGAEAQPVLLDRRAARARVSSRQFLSGWDWQAMTRSYSVERLIGRMLTPRERDVAELLLARPPRWTRQIVPLSAFAAASGLIPHFFFGPPAPGLDQAMACVIPLVLIAISALIAPLRGAWMSSTGEVSPPVGPVPVGHREMVRVAVVVGALRGLAILPVAVVAGVSSFLGAGLGAWEGALTGLRCTVVFVALHYWSYWTFTKYRTSGTSSLAPFARQSVYALLMLSFLVSAYVFVLPGLAEPWNTLSAGIMFGSGWLASRFDEWRFNRGGYDLIARPSEG